MFDIAIVGFGPSGAVAAALLGQAGHRVWVGDRLTAIYDKPRAIALDHEILRVFQQLGIADAVLPFTEPFTDSCWQGADGQPIRRLTMLPEPHPQAWTPSLVFNQPGVEGVLRRAVQQLPLVQVDLGVEVTGLDQAQDQATVHLADGRHVQARWVIACDGASSTLRPLAGIALDDLGFDEPWLVVDVLANERGLARLPATSMQFCEPDRPCSYIIGPGNHRRWEISLKPGEDPRQVATPAGTWALLQRWIGPDEGLLWRQASYRFHALVADRWRVGRVLVAGDAAHQQPPFLGQGMCQGVRDVANLAWKLDAVLKGQATDALVDSYGAERQGHVRALTTRLKAIGQLIGERDPRRARERDARLLAEAGGAVRPTPRQDLLPRLEQGLLAAADTLARGTLFPQPWLRRGAERVRMDEVHGRGWRLVLADERVPAALDSRGMTRLSLPTLGECDGVLAAWFERHGCSAALVRPDHYVFGTASSPAELLALVGQAHAALSG